MKKNLIIFLAFLSGCTEEQPPAPLTPVEQLEQIICSDNQPSKFESGVDCGGGCEPCPNGQRCTSNLDCQSQFCRRVGDYGLCFGPENDKCVVVEDDYERQLVCDTLDAVVIFCGADGPFGNLPAFSCIQPKDPLFTADTFGGAKYFCCKGAF